MKRLSEKMWILREVRLCTCPQVKDEFEACCQPGQRGMRIVADTLTQPPISLQDAAFQRWRLDYERDQCSLAVAW